jgi:hypothetical protein
VANIYETVTAGIFRCFHRQVRALKGAHLSETELLKLENGRASLRGGVQQFEAAHHCLY